MQTVIQKNIFKSSLLSLSGWIVAAVLMAGCAKYHVVEKNKEANVVTSPQPSPTLPPQQGDAVPPPAVLPAPMPQLEVFVSNPQPVMYECVDFEAVCESNAAGVEVYWEFAKNQPVVMSFKESRMFTEAREYLITVTCSAPGFAQQAVQNISIIASPSYYNSCGCRC